MLFLSNWGGETEWLLFYSVLLRLQPLLDTKCLLCVLVFSFYVSVYVFLLFFLFNCICVYTHIHRTNTLVFLTSLLLLFLLALSLIPSHSPRYEPFTFSLLSEFFLCFFVALVYIIFV